MTYPARFLLVMAANPCPCGAARDRDCSCTVQVRRRYQHRLSGPLRDRIDMRIDVAPVPRADLVRAADRAEASAVVANRVQVARQVAIERWSEHGWSTNSVAVGTALRSIQWRPERSAMADVERALDRGWLSVRGYDRVLRLAWTVADLAGHESPTSGDVGEALFFRVGSAAMAA